MSGAPEKRQTVRQLVAAGVSVRRACSFAGTARSWPAYEPRPSDRKRRRKVRTGKRVPLRAEHRNHVWTCGIVYGAAGGKTMKALTVADELTRAALAIEGARPITAGTVKRVLARLFDEHGAPEVIRSGSGGEFIAAELMERLKEAGTDTYHIEPGKPWQNGCCEPFSGRLRDECLNEEEFWSIAHARVLPERFRIEHSTGHLHSSLGYLTPAEYAARCPAGAA